jgi:hypothetical protein
MLNKKEPTKTNSWMLLAEHYKKIRPYNGLLAA